MMNYWKICAKLSTSIPGMYFIGKFMKPKDRNDNDNHHKEHLSNLCEGCKNNDCKFKIVK